MLNKNEKYSTYAEVCETYNPWGEVASQFPGIENYGMTAIQYHNYCLELHGYTPIVDSFYLLYTTIQNVYLVNRDKYDTLYNTIFKQFDPNNVESYTDTKNKTGTESTTSTGTATDRRNTYDNATMRNTAETGSSGNATTTYNITETHTNSGHGNIYDILKSARGAADLSVPLIFINDVLEAITVKIYDMAEEAEN